MRQSLNAIGTAIIILSVLGIIGSITGGAILIIHAEPGGIYVAAGGTISMFYPLILGMLFHALAGIYGNIEEIADVICADKRAAASAALEKKLEKAPSLKVTGMKGRREVTFVVETSDRTVAYAQARDQGIEKVTSIEPA